MGNPGVEASVDHSGGGAFDIKNLADPGKNEFTANVCLSAMNAPCPALESSLTASPNPIPVSGSAPYGMTTLSWSAPGVEVVDVRIGAPDGKLLVTAGNRGSLQTGAWVTEGTTFYLQDVTGGKPLTTDNTLAMLVLHLQHK